MERTFSDDFLERFVRIWGEIEEADAPPDDEPELDDSPRVADSMRERRDGLYSDFTLSFAGIVQALADQDGGGNIEALDDERLMSLVRAADDAIKGWSEGAETELKPPEPKTPLQVALRVHYEMERMILDLPAENGGGPGVRLKKRRAER
jgi:hypothetical protein